MQKLWPTARCVKISDRKLVIKFLEGHLLYNNVISDIHSGFCMTDRRVGDNGFYYNFSMLDNGGHRCYVGLRQL